VQIMQACIVFMSLVIMVLVVVTQTLCAQIFQTSSHWCKRPVNKGIKSDSVNLSSFFAKSRKKVAKFTPQLMLALASFLLDETFK
jgi:hypothetical protein